MGEFPNRCLWYQWSIGVPRSWFPQSVRQQGRGWDNQSLDPEIQMALATNSLFWLPECHIKTSFSTYVLMFKKKKKGGKPYFEHPAGWLIGMEEIPGFYGWRNWGSKDSTLQVVRKFTSGFIWMTVSKQTSKKPKTTKGNEWKRGSPPSKAKDLE